MPPVRAASFLICGNTVTEDVGINPIIITNANSTLKNCFETLFFISLSSFSGIHFICHTGFQSISRCMVSGRMKYSFIFQHSGIVTQIQNTA